MTSSGIADDWLGREEVAGGAGRSHRPESVLSVNEGREVGLFLLGKRQLDKVLKSLSSGVQPT